MWGIQISLLYLEAPQNSEVNAEAQHAQSLQRVERRTDPQSQGCYALFLGSDLGSWACSRTESLKHSRLSSVFLGTFSMFPQEWD